MKKWLIYTVLTLLIISVGVFFFAKSYLTRNYLVDKLEESIKSRVQVGEVNISLLGEVELKDVIITQRDSEADNKVPHDDRSALAEGDIKLKSIKFRLSFREIISRKLSIESIDIDGVVAKVVMLEDGSLSIEELFDNPDDAEVEDEKGFNAKEHDKFVTEIKELNITNLAVDMIVQKTQLLVQGKNAYMKVSDIQVNPKQLETVNNAKIDLGGEFGLFSLDKNVEYGKVGITGDTELTIFNSVSGDLEPDMKLNLVMSPDSYLTTKVPMINKMWDSIWRAFDRLASIGIDKVRLPDRAEFRDNQKIKLAYKRGKVDLLEAFSIHMSDWELKMLADSNLKTGADEHVANMKLYVASKISTKVSSFLGRSATVGKLLGKLAGDSGAMNQRQAWLENGRIVLAAESSGPLSKPKISIKNNIAGPIKDTLEGLLDKDNRDRLKQGADLLKGFLR